MLKNIFNRKQTIRAQTLLDLRDYTPRALENIKAIEAVAVLILPENPTSEYIEAFSKIKLNAVAFQRNLAKDKKVVTVNGIKLDKDVSLPDNCFAVLNGIYILSKPIKGTNIEYCINGILLKKKGIMNDAKCVSENGIVYEMDFDDNKVKFFSGKIDIDKNFIRNIEVGTLVVVGDSLTISDDVTEEDIADNDVKFFVGNSIICNNNIKGCIQARSIFGNKIIVKDK